MSNDGEHPGDSARPDPYALTRPIPIVSGELHPITTPATYEAPEVVAAPVPRVESVAAPVGKPAKAPYTPIFGSLGGYAFSRFVALVIDFAIVPSVLACFIFNMADRGTLALAPRSEGGFEVIAGIAFGVALVFAIIFESIFETTLGKALFGLGVRRGTGQHAGLQRVFVRYVLLPIDLLAIGSILALVTRRHQRIGDFAAGTVVARHRIGGFITGLALVIFAGLIYAQATIGGGIASILGVTAEGAFFMPTIVGGALADVGIGAQPIAPTVMPSPGASPTDNVGIGNGSGSSAPDPSQSG